MKRILAALTLLASVLTSHAQERRVQNRPYTDLREFHFGVLVGTHLQDLELNNIGPQMIDLDDGNGVVQKIVATQLYLSVAYGSCHVLWYTTSNFP